MHELRGLYEMNFKEYCKMMDEQEGGGAPTGTGGTTSTGQGSPSGFSDKVGEEPNDPNIARFSQRIGVGTKKRKVIKPFNVSPDERLKWSRKNRLV